MALFGKGELQYEYGEGTVRFLNGEKLSRPTTLPKKYLALAAIFVLIAAAVGGLFLQKAIDTAVYGPQRAQEQLEASLSKQVSYDFPILNSLMPKDDAAIRQTLADSGSLFYDLSSPEDNPNGGFDTVRLPEGMTTDDAAKLYSKGIAKLDPVDAAWLLNGSWTLNVNRNEYVDMRIRYCDFASTSIDEAIQNAMVAQGLDQSILGEFGEDNAGNTFQSGVVEVDGTMYSWRVSACSLSAVYDFYGFPENGVYVGVRITE